jgi:predicted short-subunit dehydrogenase-like oxidoreductase (DUF2520 family)
MKVVIIGSGNVATVLGRKIKAAGHEVLQVVSRNLEHAKVLGEILDCEITNDFNNTSADGELYLVALSDTALEDLHMYLRLNHSLVVHTAGSVTINVLQKISTNYGVLYPLQSLRTGMEQIPEIPLLADGNTPESLTLIEDFALTISNKVHHANDEQRLHLHLAAVVVSNFTNHLFTLANDYCKKTGTDFNLLLPLIKETVNRLQFYSPEAVQTGPAIRNDRDTTKKHLKMLEDHPELQKIYEKMTESIWDYHKSMQ